MQGGWQGSREEGGGDCSGRARRIGVAAESEAAVHVLGLAGRRDKVASTAAAAAVRVGEPRQLTYSTTPAHLRRYPGPPQAPPPPTCGTTPANSARPR